MNPTLDYHPYTTASICTLKETGRNTRRHYVINQWREHCVGILLQVSQQITYKVIHCFAILYTKFLRSKHVVDGRSATFDTYILKPIHFRAPPSYFTYCKYFHFLRDTGNNQVLASLTLPKRFETRVSYVRLRIILNGVSFKRDTRKQTMLIFFFFFWKMRDSLLLTMEKMRNISKLLHM